MSIIMIPSVGIHARSQRRRHREGLTLKTHRKRIVVSVEKVHGGSSKSDLYKQTTVLTVVALAFNVSNTALVRVIFEFGRNNLLLMVCLTAIPKYYDYWLYSDLKGILFLEMHALFLAMILSHMLTS